MSYDKNGNILGLQRNGDYDAQSGFIEIDNLNYYYKTDSPNQLAKVDDVSSPNNSTLGFKNGSNTDDDYSYDANGNMTIDKNKGIASIKYNHLNLPTEIIFTTTPTVKKITYLYSATGEKLQKTVTNDTSTTITDYLGGFQYIKVGTAAVVLQYFSHPEGYVNFDTGVYKYVFNYTDHLGNIRVSYTKDETTGLPVRLEQNHYYPFGLKHTNYNTEIMKLRGPDPIASVTNPYRYKYNGKELQDELGLNMYDYGARNYDPAIGRWMNIDPLAEKYFGATLYNYVLNNPINAIDPDGMDVYLLLESGKTILALKEKDKNTDTLYTVTNGTVTNPITNERSEPTIFDMKDTNGDGSYSISDGITVNKGIIGQLSNSSGKINGDKVYTSKSNYSKQNEQDYFSLFKYLSDNSQAEFGLDAFNENGKVSIRLVTERDTGEVASPENFGIKQKDIIYSYHSHPGIRPN